ncbi:hypothetical protein HMPREF9294_0945 [Porphyromonas asaccharolytica PR426713P-I]|nr:hypothetical protein HMPREF9294_0945 [Porphyromonas asaccharolytica PR426713P-I]
MELVSTTKRARYDRVENEKKERTLGAFLLTYILYVSLS